MKYPANLVDALLQQLAKRCQKCCSQRALYYSRIATHVKLVAMHPAIYLCDDCALGDDACKELPEAKLVRVAVEFMHGQEMLY